MADSIPDSPNKLDHNSEKGCVPCGIQVMIILIFNYFTSLIGCQSVFDQFVLCSYLFPWK